MGIPEHLRTKAIGGASFHFDVLLGRVAAEKKWSETRVWGGGGGGQNIEAMTKAMTGDGA